MLRPYRPFHFLKPILAVACAILTQACSTNLSWDSLSGTVLPPFAVLLPADLSSVQSSFSISGVCYAGTNVVISGVQISGSPVVTPCSGSSSFSTMISVAGPDGAFTVTTTQTLPDTTVVTDTKTYTRDTVAPALTVTYPASSTQVKSNFTVTGTCEAGLSVFFTSSVSISPASIVCPVSGVLNTSVTLGGVDGAVILAVNQTDAAGNNTAYNPTGLVKDSVAPSIAVSSPLAGSSHTASSFVISGTCESPYNVSVTGTGITGGIATCTSNAFSLSIMLTGADGAYSAVLDSTDAAGNTTAITHALVRDTLAPVLTVTSPAASSDHTASAFNVTGTCETGLSVVISGTGVSGGSAVCSGGTFTQSVTLTGSDGPVTLNINETDAAGNNSSAPLNLNRDTVGPAIAVSSPTAGSFKNASAFTISGTCESPYSVTIGGTGVSGGVATCTSNAFTLSISLTGTDGSKTVTLSSNDAAGNATNITHTLIRDTVAPSLATTSPLSGTSRNATAFTVTGTCESPYTVTVGGTGVSGGVASCSSNTFSQSVSLTGTDGAVTVTLSSTDGAGNVGNGSLALIRDTVAPSLTVSTPVNLAAVQGSVTVSGTCESPLVVSLSGTSVPSPTSVTCTANAFSSVVTLGASDGSVSLSFQQTDAAGNASTLTTLSLTKDTVAPVVTIGASTPTAGTFYQSMIGAGVQGTCETGLSVVLNGAGVSGGPYSVPCTSGNYSFGGIPLSASDGSKSFTVTQTDPSGNVGSASRSVNRDATGPETVNFVSLQTIYIGGAGVMIVFNTADAGVGMSGGLTDVTLKYSSDGGTTYSSTLATALAAGSGSYLWTPPVVNNTTSKLRLIATDALGNQTILDTPNFSLMGVVPQFANAPNWNDYVRKSDLVTACNGSESGNLYPCLHGGERKVVMAGEYTSCSQLTAVDSLLAFNWACSIDGGTGRAIFTSKLRSSKGARDLLNAMSWKTNHVNIYFNASLVYQTPDLTWWSNSVSLIPNSSSATINLNAAGMMYTLSGAQSGKGYNITADKVSVIVMPGASYTASATSLTNNCRLSDGTTVSPDAGCVLASGGRKFLWIEGDFSGLGVAGLNYGLYFVNTLYSMFNQITVRESGNAAFKLTGSSYNQVNAFRVVNSFQAMRVDNSHYNRISDFQGFGIWNVGLSFMNTSSNNAFNGVLLASLGNPGASYSGIGILTDGTLFQNNVFTRMTIAQSSNEGIALQASTGSILHNLFVEAAGLSTAALDSVSLSDIGPLTTTTFSQLAVADGNYGLSSYGSGVTNNKFTGNIVVNDNMAGAQNCYNTTSPSAGFTATSGVCANQGASNASIRGAYSSLASTFVGAIGVNDVANSSDSAGSGLYASISDWLNFDTFYRGWGKNGTFPGSASSRACLAGNTCLIYDWRPKATDTTLIRNRSNSVTSANPPWTGGMAACPNIVDGNDTLTSHLGLIYLQNAVEVIGDDYGNENGLCESNEACFYTPNFGYYQGEGLIEQCTFNSSGGLSGITMYGFPNNGG